MTKMIPRQNQQWQIITDFKCGKNDRKPTEEGAEYRFEFGTQICHLLIMSHQASH